MVRWTSRPADVIKGTNVHSLLTIFKTLVRQNFENKNNFLVSLSYQQIYSDVDITVK